SGTLDRLGPRHPAPVRDRVPTLLDVAHGFLTESTCCPTIDVELITPGGGVFVGVDDLRSELRCVHGGIQPWPPSAGADLLVSGVGDRLDVVAIGIADEDAVVALVVLGPQSRLMQDLSAEAHRGVTEGSDRCGVG